jgi:allantoin racemase
VPVPLLEGIACGVLLAETLVWLGPTNPRTGSLQAPVGRQSVGLAPALAARLATKP